MAPRNEIVSASLLQRVSPLYSTFQPYICSTTDSGIESAELPDGSREEEKSGVGRRLITVNSVLAERLHGAYSFLTCAVSPQGHELSKAIAEPGRYEAFAH